MENQPRQGSNFNNSSPDAPLDIDVAGTITRFFGWCLLIIGLSASLFLFYRIYTVLQYPERHAATMQYWGRSIGEDVTRFEISGNVIIHDDGSISIPEPIRHDSRTTETLALRGTEVSGLPVLKISIQLGQVIGYGIAIILMVILIKIAFGFLTIGATLLEKANPRSRRKRRTY